MLEEGVIEAKPGDADPGAIALMRRLAEKSRARWPEWAEQRVRLGLKAGAKSDDSTSAASHVQAK